MRLGPIELIFLVVLVAMPVSSYWFVFKPRNEATAEARGEIQQKELMLEKLTAATARAHTLEEKNEKLTEAIELVEARLPSSKDVDVILSNVATLARRSRLELPKVKTLPAIASSHYTEQPLEMTMRGDGDDFYLFLLDLEGLDRITRIPEMVIKRSGEQDGQVEAQFTLSIYFQSDVATAEAN